jgi:hypothetical protein
MRGQPCLRLPLIRLPAPSPRKRGEGGDGNRVCLPLPACGESRVRGKSLELNPAGGLGKI